MILLSVFMSSLAVADRLGTVISMGPPQLGATFHQSFADKLEAGIQLSGSGFMINDCGLVYRDSNSSTGTFECNLRSVWAGQLDVEAFYEHELPIYWEIKSSIAVGPYLGIGVHSDGVFERVGAALELRIDNEEFNYGFRFGIGQHGLLNTVLGFGITASVPFDFSS